MCLLEIPQRRASDLESKRVGRRKWTNRRIQVPAFMRSCRIEEELTWVKTFGKEVEEYVTKVIAKDGKDKKDKKKQKQSKIDKETEKTRQE
ncbi:hypothetical protein Tco_0543152 [Tanacetum coccineum]